MIRPNRKSETPKITEAPKSMHLSYVVDVKYETIEQRIARLRKGIPASTPSPKNYGNYRAQLLPAELRRSLTHSRSTEPMGNTPHTATHEIPKRSRPNFDLIHAKKSTQALRRWKYDHSAAQPEPSSPALRSFLRRSQEEQPQRKNPEDDKSKYNELMEDMQRLRTGGSSGLDLGIHSRVKRNQWNEATLVPDCKQEQSSYDRKQSYHERPVGIAKIRKLPIHKFMGKP